MANPPPKLPPKPRITLHIPTNQGGFQGGGRQPSTAGSNSIHVNPLYVPNYNNNFNNMQPMTPVTALPQNNPYYNPFMNPGKASEYMFKQFEGFKDFTMNTAKSGLSVGEKSAFWMYNKLSTWSKKWFTHLMLIMMMMSYTALGAFIFKHVEGNNETFLKTDMRLKRENLSDMLHKMVYNKSLLQDPDKWRGVAILHLYNYEIELEQFIKKGYTPKGDEEDGNTFKPKPTWTFWNAVFYCGTIYTTIGDKSDLRRNAFLYKYARLSQTRNVPKTDEKTW